MTTVDTYSAECEDCGHIDLLKFGLKSFNSFMPLPDMDFSTACSECDSENMTVISFDDAMEKERQRMRDEPKD